MIKLLSTLPILFFAHVMLAQTVIDFEDLTVPADSFLNGNDGSGGLTVGDLFLTHTSSAFGWSGWSISNQTDTLTPGYLNQYSARPGMGASSSANFAVSFSVNNILQLTAEAAGKTVEGLYITNSTYAYYSILDGDTFTKKFGGVTGNDPDYFLLTIKAYRAGELSTDSVNFYLADYRFEDNSQDYIIDDWQFIDLSTLGAVDSLSFALSSTDNSPMFGMNTPAYFCIDDVMLSNSVTNTREVVVAPTLFEVYPNPAADFLKLKNLTTEPGLVSLYTLDGRSVLAEGIQSSNQQIDVRQLAKGTYVVKLETATQVGAQLFVKE